MKKDNKHLSSVLDDEDEGKETQTKAHELLRKLDQVCELFAWQENRRLIFD
jgi:hypothetical protein